MSKTKAKSKTSVSKHPRAQNCFPLPTGWDAAMRARLVAGLDGVADADIIDGEQRNLTCKVDGKPVDSLVIMGIDLPYGPDDILKAAAV